MRDTLAPGIESTVTVRVAAEQTAPHVAVLSTPSMIGLIEGACMNLAAQHLDEGETTVGTHVCVSHVGVASPGDDVEIHVRLDKVERRRLTFATRVNGPNGLMSEGTHQRTVIDRSRFG